ncbi:MAG: hypothetical protein LUF90_00125 [Rikenellaceae bacterium]|nr:hypothetical protein [Rikenellaceae bacterium]
MKGKSNSQHDGRSNNGSNACRDENGRFTSCDNSSSSSSSHKGRSSSSHDGRANNGKNEARDENGRFTSKK